MALWPGTHRAKATLRSTRRCAISVNCRNSGANLVRVYENASALVLDLASTHGIKVLVDVGWDKSAVFLDSQTRRAAREAVRQAVRGCWGHPAVLL